MISNDKYLGFTYNDIKLNMSSTADFKGFIENSGNDLSFFNTPAFTNEFAVPNFGNRTFYLGNTKNNRTFSLKIQLDKINMKTYREFLAWLSPDSTGILSFDYNSKYGYKVKLENITTSEYHIAETISGVDFYYIDLTVDFITLEHYAAEWIEGDVYWDSLDSDHQNLVNNNFNIPFMEYDIEYDYYTIYNFHNIVNYFIIEFDNNLTITEESEDIVQITSAGDNAKYYSEFGIAIKADGKFLECGPKPKISINPQDNRELKISGTNWKLIPTSREVI